MVARLPGFQVITDPGGRTVAAPRFQRPHAHALAGPAGKVEAGRVRVPVLVMHGRADDVAPVTVAEALAAELSATAPRHEAPFFKGH
jgi:pimeloyl-ACP methyl ester carboxylesterase